MPESNSLRVVVEISDGVCYVVRKPQGVAVEVYDRDDENPNARPTVFSAGEVIGGVE